VRQERDDINPDRFGYEEFWRLLRDLDLRLSRDKTASGKPR
jgi:hypothetical protein